MVTAAHEIRIEDCATGPSHPFDFTTRPFLAQGCVETPARTFNVGRFYPDGDWVMEDEPIPGVECMAEWLPDSSSGGPCVEEDNVFGFVAGSWSEDGGIRYSMAIVTDETVRVVAATSGGEQIVAIPYERMAFLWWDSGDLINVVAETPAGDVDLLQVGS